jgi:TM2 domain-containing membrane protein YozV
MKDPRIALLVSVLFPGLGQIYLGERAKGWTLLCMAGGVWVSLVINHSLIACLFMGVIYVAVMIPAALDAFQTASGKPRTFAGDTVPYVIVMLLLVGPFAIPLLWQSRKFSIRAKVLWTIGVIVIALLAIAVTTFAASLLEQILNSGESLA